jgi:hypothetical protein
VLAQAHAHHHALGLGFIGAAVVHAPMVARHCDRFKRARPTAVSGPVGRVSPEA